MYLDLTWTIKEFAVTSLPYLQFMDPCNCQLVLVLKKEMILRESTHKCDKLRFLGRVPWTADRMKISTLRYLLY
jgi:hypothetical protein